MNESRKHYTKWKSVTKDNILDDSIWNVQNKEIYTDKWLLKGMGGKMERDYRFLRGGGAKKCSKIWLYNSWTILRLY